MPKKLQIRLAVMEGREGTWSAAARADGEAVYEGATLQVRPRV
jgi:hypothetical protein